MPVRGLVDRVGSGMINLIFFERNGELKLVAWERTNQRAATWINKEVSTLEREVAWESWPEKIIVVFVIFEGEHQISVEHIGQLVREIKEESRGYEGKKLPREEGDLIEQHVSLNWETYKKLKGIM
jgi:hypothetical protein